MSTLNLKEIERKAWRSTFEDGLWDIYFGLIMFSMALSTFDWDNISDSVPLLHNIIYFGVLLCSMLFLWAGKRFITTPRIGQARFGPTGKTRQKKVRLVLFISVILGLLVFLASLTLWKGNIGQLFPAKIIFPVFFVVNIVIVFGLLGYFWDFPRMYIIGALFALSIAVREFASIFTDVDITFYAFAIPAFIVIAMGIYYLIRFVRQNPVIEVESAAK